MYFSLNKKIFYTIFGLMIFTSMLFLMLFLGLFGEKYTKNQTQILMRNQYIISLLHENVQLQRELGRLKNKPFLGQIINEKQEILSKEKEINDNLIQNYNEKHVAIIEGSKIIGYGFLLSLISIIILGFLLQKWVANPIKKLTVLSAQVAKGNLSKRAQIDKNQVFYDEFDTLAKTFNDMLDNIEENIAEIKSKELFLQSLIDGIPDGIKVIDKNNNIILANKAYFKQIGKKNYDIKPENLYTYDYDILKELKNAKSKRVNIIQNFDNKPLSINAAPLNLGQDNKDNFYVIESIRDLTEDVKFSHEQKIASLGFLATSVAHEMKNNLGSIRIILEGLLENYAENDIQKKYLNMIYNQVLMSIQIPERLLKLARNRNDEKEAIDIESNVDEVLSLLDYEAKHNGVTINKNFEKINSSIVGNETDFKMIMLNLTQNAIKAMPSGGHLTINVSKDKNNVMVEVKDSGVGIEKEKLHHIFEPFYSDGKSRRHQGAGLGLAIVKSLVDKFKGSISVSSEIGKGSSFIIKFPKNKRNNLQN
ncbi:MAG: HAMP domain-containing protein [Alphaproteobacteria bacterium]|nr:HAMP domain-containing protein [Alphaproteobacteria bacterium]